MQYLVAYDIPDNGRRNRVARCLLNFGRRLQLSVFTCDLETRDFLRMCRKVEALLDFKEDRLQIIPLCQS
ncbi:MAG: CRISPR-associated endonuclease Cas2 [Chloroherpetonaceae bacterium]|nr:CRISPR-associated endonuclease Cas2 [Chthonomonadaceae bacterium]MDW8209286.1 CRISPR-associated endonuclease Cas2 [Chloroherpetonaceae bacterium]